jgi:single-stranded DNA-binding protein
MSQIKATFTGNIVADPELREAGGTHLLEFPVYVNHTKKDKDTKEYVKTGDTSKIRVTLWRDLADDTDVIKGDLVEIVATLIEKEFDKKDGTKGRSLQTDYVESVIVKYRKDDSGDGQPAPVDNQPAF